jgi:hypothetical protein
MSADSLLLGDEPPEWPQRRGAVTDHAADVTLVEVLADLRSQGYSGGHQIDADGAICCSICGLCQPANQVEADGFRRLEGASDPGDMALVLAVSCPACGDRAAIVLRYGPEAEPAEAALLTALTLPSEAVVPPRDQPPLATPPRLHD